MSLEAKIPMVDRDAETEAEIEAEMGSVTEAGVDTNTRIEVAANLDRLLNIPEIFENVLLQLPMKDLLFAQRVCKKWQTVIEVSPQLQETLFFKPASHWITSISRPESVLISGPLSAPTSPSQSLPSTPTESMSQTSASPTSTLHESRLMAATSVDPPGVQRQAFEQNPLLRSKFEPFFTEPKNQYDQRRPKALLEMPWNLDEQSRKAFQRPEASWRKMLLIQPAAAITKVEVFHETQAMRAKWVRIPTKPIDPISQGLRMGWVYDRCCEVALVPIGSFGLCWRMLHTPDADWAPKLTIHLCYVQQCARRPADAEWMAMWSDAYHYQDEIEYDEDNARVFHYR